MNELLRQWAGGVCAGCMLAGAVQLLLPASRHTAVIKNIAVLYIVLAILSPAKMDVKPNDITDWNEAEPQVLYDTTALQTSQTEAVLANTFTERLAACGVQAQVTVRLQAGADGAQTLSVQASAPTEAQSRAAALLLEEWIGEGGTVECQTRPQ